MRRTSSASRHPFRTIKTNKGVRVRGHLRFSQASILFFAAPRRPFLRPHCVSPANTKYQSWGGREETVVLLKSLISPRRHRGTLPAPGQVSQFQILAGFRIHRFIICSKMFIVGLSKHQAPFNHVSSNRLLLRATPDLPTTPSKLLVKQKLARSLF